MSRPALPPTERVAADLRARIEAGEWDHGEQMPATREVADHYRVSSRTAAKAYRILADEGLVIVRPSWGTHRALPSRE